MEVQLIKLNKIKVNDKNPRTITEDKLRRLVESILVFPKMLTIRPIVVDDKGVALGGNMRTRALKEIKKIGRDGIPERLQQIRQYANKTQEEKNELLAFWESWFKEQTVPVIYADTLTEEEKREFIIKDNSSFGAWDWDVLANEWESEQLEDWGVDVWQIDETEDDGNDAREVEVQEDDFDVCDEQPSIVKRGEVWKLGEHRLMCGDSTDPECFAKLMNGERADIAFTSPPYNMQATNIAKAFDSDKVKDSYGIKEGTYNEFSDALSNEDYAKLLNGALDCCLAYSDEVLFNIGILAASKNGIIDMMAAHKDKFSDILVWNKNQCMPLCLPTQIHLLGHVCELIFCFSNAGTRAFSHSQWELGKMHNRIDVGKQNANEYSKIHHATFPVELPGYIIKWFTEKSVLDVFGGTGTTMIAAEQLRRKCFMMELDAHYCDVIIARWEQFTGKQAVKIE